MKIIENLTGKDADIVHIKDTERTAADVSRIRKKRGYEPKHGLKKGSQGAGDLTGVTIEASANCPVKIIARPTSQVVLPVSTAYRAVNG